MTHITVTMAGIGIFIPWESGVLGFTRVFTDLTLQTLNNNNNKNLQKKAHWVVDFYSPWCRSCQNFAPEFDILARMIKWKVKPGEVHCQAYPQTHQKAGIKAYPSVEFYYYERTSKSIWEKQINSSGAKIIIAFIHEKLKTSSNQWKEK